MIEIMALLMFIGDPQELKEMTYTPTVSECLKKKRIASRKHLRIIVKKF